MKKREEIQKEHKWNLNDLFKDLKAWEESYKTVEGKIAELAAYKGTLSQSPKKLLNFLNLKTETSLLFEKIYVYARMNEDENTKDSKKQTLVQKLSPLELNYSTNLAFFENEFLEIKEEALAEYYEKEEGLTFYKKYLNEILRGKNHILTPEKEEVLAQTNILYSADDTYSKLNNADMSFDPVIDSNGQVLPLTNGTYYTYISSKDREIRKQAFKNMYKSYMGLKNTLASTMLANVKKDVFYSKIRNYHSSLEASLYSDNVPLSVYENLIETVKENSHHMHKYVALRKKLLGVDELHMYDMYAPLVPGYDEKIPYEKAYDTMKEALKVLGDDYVNMLEEARNGGWIDVYETEGKRTGAYAWGAYGTHPYVLLNHRDDLDSMFTLAHEMGHALHSHYSDSSLPYLYAQYTIFVAEVASTVNEVLLMKHLLKNSTDKEMKISLVNEFLDKFKGTLYRQTQFAEFEKITHERVESDESLTGDDMNEIYLGLNKEYYGSSLVHDEEIQYEWSRIPHFYTSFYVYKYATGFSAAIAIADRILNEGQAAIDDYLKFLKSGGSDYPIELLKIAGVDMNSKKPIENALKMFGELVDEMEELTK